MNEFDKELDKRGLHFTRYADDVIITVKSEAAANRVMKSVTSWLEKHLRVQVNATKTKVARPNQIKYLGHSFYLKDGKWRPKPHLKSIKKLEYKLVPLLRRNWGVSIEYRISKINEVTRGWINNYRLCDMKSVMKRLDQWIRHHLRMILWKQWKTIKNRKANLINLGVMKKKAWIWANSRKGPNRNAQYLGIWLTNERIACMGFLSLEAHYAKVHVINEQLMLEV